MNYDILDSVLIYSTKYSVVIYVCRVLQHAHTPCQSQGFLHFLIYTAYEATCLENYVYNMNTRHLFYFYQGAE